MREFFSLYIFFFFLTTWMIYNVLVLITVKLIFKKDFYRFVIARNYLSECCAEVPVQDGDIRKSRTHLLPQPHWAYSYIWKNFLSKNLKSGWMMTTHWANKKKNTSKMVGEAGMKPHHKPHHAAATHSAEGTQNLELLPEELRVQNPHRASHML